MSIVSWECRVCGETGDNRNYECRCNRERIAKELAVKDNPDFDATDGAHPAWWRGHDHTVQTFCREVNNILDGKDDGRGVASEPWESTRRRLIRLRESLLARSAADHQPAT